MIHCRSRNRSVSIGSRHHHASPWSLFESEHDCAFRQVTYDQWRRSSGKPQYVMHAAAHMGSCYLLVDASAFARLPQTETRLGCQPSTRLKTPFSQSPPHLFASFHQTLHIDLPSPPFASSMTEHRCASGACRNGGTRFCGSCRTTCYCSRDCQKAHWRRHKLTCDGPNAFSPLRPGVFDFMRLPREVRDKVSNASFLFEYLLLVLTNADI